MNQSCKYTCIFVYHVFSCIIKLHDRDGKNSNFSLSLVIVILNLNNRYLHIKNR